MCRLFIEADPKLWESTQRSVRVDGMVTSIRLENAFWCILEEIAKRDQLTIPGIITRLFHESVDAGHDMGNFTSFLRVCCSRYLMLQLGGQIPADNAVTIAELDAETILTHERAVHNLA